MTDDSFDASQNCSGLQAARTENVANGHAGTLPTTIPLITSIPRWPPKISVQYVVGRQHVKRSVAIRFYIWKDVDL